MCNMFLAVDFLDNMRECFNEICPETWVTFFGSIIASFIGAIVTIAVMLLTMRHDGKRAKEAERNAMKPWLIGHVDDVKCGVMKNFDEIKSEFKKLEDWVIYFNGEQWVSDVSFDKVSSDLLSDKEKTIVIYFTVRNVGAKSAINLYFKTSYENVKSKPMCLSAMAVDCTKRFVIIFGATQLSENKNLSISFIYTDIVASNAYRQDIHFLVKGPNGLKIENGGFLGTPYQINLNEIPDLRNGK